MRSDLPESNQQSFLFQDLASQLNPTNPLYKLSQRVPWSEFEEAFGELYATDGRPAKPIRLMVSLLILKHVFNVSDERVVAAWVENPYWQFFSGMAVFQWKLPCDPTELVYFRKRIGEMGVELILRVSVQMQGKERESETVILDTTVQEKNITYPHDSKLYRKVADNCVAIAERENIPLRQTYRRVLRRLIGILRTRNFPRARKKARKAVRRMRTIAGRLVRELLRKFRPNQHEAYRDQMQCYQRIIAQRRQDKNKIYSVHEPAVYCLAKGKDQKHYEFGSKVSIAINRHGVIVGAINFAKNTYDGHTVATAVHQIHRVTGTTPSHVFTDRGYRKSNAPIGTTVITPYDVPKERDATHSRRLSRWMRRRSAIEPVIGHLKSDHRLCRNFLKGWIGDEINVMMAAVGFNFRRLLRKFLRLGSIQWILLVLRCVFRSDDIHCNTGLGPRLVIN